MAEQQPDQAEQIAVKPPRGRETAGDMVRSLGLVLAAVVMIWFFAQPPGSDQQTIRVVDPAGEISAFAAAQPSTPVPGSLPAQWRATSSTLAPGSLRVGYVTASGRYAEYAATTAPRAIADLTGDGRRLAPVDVAGTAWEQYQDADGSLSLVRSYGAVTVVLGTLRSTGELNELTVLARSLALG